MTAWLLLLVAVVLLLACAAFVAFEFALVTVDRPTVERAAAAGDRRAGSVLAALRSLSTQLSGAQVGITVTNLAIGFVAEPSIADLVRGPIGAIGLGEGATRSVSVTFGLVLATVLTMVFGELVPKNLAIADPLAAAKTVAGFQRGFTRATAPLIRLLNGTANALLRKLFGIEPQEELASARSPEELSSLVRRSGQVGTLPAATASLLQRGLAFGDLRASDVATPRVQMSTVHDDDPVAAVLTAARETGHSRFPVVAKEDIDDVRGVVHVKHALAVARDERDAVPVASVMVRALEVPTSRRLDDLLTDLRGGSLQMAVLVDEYGGTSGVVTVEDLVEELVGAVTDEHDEQADTEVVDLGDGTWSVSGLLRPDEVTALTGLAVPADRHYDTMGGLVLHLLGRVPEEGDEVTAELVAPPEFADELEGPLGGVRVLVQRVEGARADRVLVSALPTGEDEEPQS
ncbi:hemolysin family protein [Modestobacter sp. NPDC049651]|uniref:hemolysin family protein n=1 Tax=unclassified Modestobacter TaxID=2643866 RepID=UPI0033E07136